MEYNFIAVGLSVYCKIIQESHQLFYPLEADQYVNNTACDDFLDTISDHYKKRGLKGILVMVVAEIEWKTFSELRYFEVGLIKRGIKMRRIQLKHLNEGARLDNDNNLYYKEELVSFVFLRHGFNL